MSRPIIIRNAPRELDDKLERTTKEDGGRKTATDVRVNPTDNITNTILVDEVKELINEHQGTGGGGGEPDQYLKSIFKDTSNKTITITNKNGVPTSFEYGATADPTPAVSFVDELPALSSALDGHIYSLILKAPTFPSYDVQFNMGIHFYKPNPVLIAGGFVTSVTCEYQSAKGSYKLVLTSSFVPGGAAALEIPVSYFSVYYINDFLRDTLGGYDLLVQSDSTDYDYYCYDMPNISQEDSILFVKGGTLTKDNIAGVKTYLKPGSGSEEWVLDVENNTIQLEPDGAAINLSDVMIGCFRFFNPGDNDYIVCTTESDPNVRIIVDNGKNALTDRYLPFTILHDPTFTMFGGNYVKREGSWCLIEKDIKQILSYELNRNSTNPISCKAVYNYVSSEVRNLKPTFETIMDNMVTIDGVRVPNISFNSLSFFVETFISSGNVTFIDNRDGNQRTTGYIINGFYDESTKLFNLYVSYKDYVVKYSASKNDHSETVTIEVYQNNLTPTQITNILAGVTLAGTALQPTDIVDNVTSTATNKTLSAKQGKLLNDRINNLESVGRFLALWDCTTGLPLTNPGELPYAYHSGDYYRISAVGTTNYMPTGSSYTGAASTVEYSGTVTTSDTWFFDGTNWSLQTGSAVTDAVEDVIVDGTSVVSGKVAYIDLSGKQDALDSDQMDAVDSGITATKVGEITSNTTARHTHSNKTLLDGITSDSLVSSSDRTNWNGKQAGLTSSQLAAANSGITSTKVAEYDDYATSKQDTISGDQLSALNSGITAGKVTAYDNYSTTKQDALNTTQLSAVNSGIDSTKVADIELNSAERHNHANKTILDGIDSTKLTNSTEKSTWNGKQDQLVSGTNIKTVNGNSLLGSGNIEIGGSGTVTWGTISGTLSSQTDLKTALDGKQESLSTAQLQAANSGITYSKVQTYDAYETGKQDTIDASHKLAYSLISGTPTIPTKVSDLTNDSGFVTSSYHDSTKQNSLTTAQLNAVNSGITSGKVSTYDGYATSKQATLVSGTNIKTINNTSLLGSGNITISGGSGTVTSVTGGTGLHGGTITTSGTLAVLYGSTSGTACEGNDSRLTNARTPTSHAVSTTTYGAGTTTNYGHVKTQSGDMSGTTSTDGIAAGLGHTHSNYQATISDLTTIRTGAGLGATAVQPAAISDMATKTWVNGQSYATTTQLATKSTVSVSPTGSATDVINYITVDGVQKKIGGGSSAGGLKIWYYTSSINPGSNTAYFSSLKDLTTGEYASDTNKPKVNDTAIGYNGAWGYVGYVGDGTATILYIDKPNYNTCLEKGTLIKMADGTEKPIEDVKVGELILSYDFTNHKTTPAVCLFSASTAYEEYTDYLIFDNGEYLSCTENHEIYSVDKGRNIFVHDMKEGEKTLDSNGNEITLLAYHHHIYHFNKKAFYEIVTSNNCFYANNILNAMHPVSKYRWLNPSEINPEVLEIFKQDAEEYAAWSFLVEDKEFLQKSVYYMKNLREREHKIAEYKKFLADTDYVAIKKSEGLEVDESIITERENARSEINRMQNEINNTFDPEYKALLVEYSPLGNDVLLTNEERQAKYFIKSNKRDNSKLSVFKKYYKTK